VGSYFSRDGGEATLLAERYQGCKSKLFAEHPMIRPELSEVRRMAVQELTRLHRLGVDIKGPEVELRQALYWDFMK
jgi:hypothetical protein